MIRWCSARIGSLFSSNGRTEASRRRSARAGHGARRVNGRRSRSHATARRAAIERWPLAARSRAEKDSCTAALGLEVERAK
jgi:hypothetical protein